MALDPDYVQAVRKLCDEKDLVLIVDEVVSCAVQSFFRFHLTVKNQFLFPLRSEEHTSELQSQR